MSFTIQKSSGVII